MKKADPKQARKPYKKPRIRAIGSLAELTAGGGSVPNVDGQSTMAMLMV